MPLTRIAVPSRHRMSWLLVLVLLGGCVGAPLEGDAPAQAGGLIRAEPLAWYPAWFVRLALWATDVPGPTPIRCGVRTVRVEYWTVDHTGRVVPASGLYAEPTCGDASAVVSYQHGTVSRREDVPSTPGPEGIAAAALFAGAGYVTVAADYPGMGRAPGVHPYLHVASTTASTRDLLQAARVLAARRGRAWPGALLLVGVSQGGHATAALHRALEHTPLPATCLLGSAVASSPFDLAGMSFPVALAGGTRDHAAYLALLAHGYSHVEGRPLSGLLRAPWDARVPEILAGAFDEDDLPRDPRALFREDFLADYDAGRPTWLLSALADNGVDAWAPRAPLRAWYGSADEVVSPREAPIAVERMRALGGDAEAIDLGPLDHVDAALAAVPAIRAWFDTLVAVPASACAADADR